MYSVQVCHIGVHRLLCIASVRHAWRNECASGRRESDVRWQPSVVPQATQ